MSKGKAKKNLIVFSHRIDIDKDIFLNISSDSTGTNIVIKGQLITPIKITNNLSIFQSDEKYSHEVYTNQKIRIYSSDEDPLIIVKEIIRINKKIINLALKSIKKRLPLEF